MRRLHTLVFSLLLLLPASAAPAATNLCLDRPTYASGYEGAYQPANAVDGTTTTNWCSLSADSYGYKWIQIDLGSTKTVRRWVVKQAGTNGDDPGYYNMGTYELWVWNGSNWYVADRIDGNHLSITGRDIPPATAQWFGLVVSEGSAADDGARVEEFELYEQSLNLAYGKVAKASSNVAGETPSLAVDGSVSEFVDDSRNYVPNSKWCSTASGNKWLQVDLGATKSVLKWVVHHAGAGGEDPRWNTKDFQLQGSADAKTWTTLDTVTGNLANTTNRNLSAAKSDRYFRLLITNAGSDGAARIYEFQLYGPEILPTPAATFTEAANAGPMWHSKTLKLMKYDSEAVVYFDQDPQSQDANNPSYNMYKVDPKYASYVHQLVKTIWNDIRKTWGAFGLTNRIVLFAHQCRSGFEGHSSPYYRYNVFENVVDVRWSGAWDTTEPNLAQLKRIIIHEIGHIIEEGANYSFSPGGAAQASHLWPDDPFGGLLNWDVLQRIGTSQDVSLAHDEDKNSDGSDWGGGCSEGCPRGTTPANVAWFGKFFEPIYNAYGGIGFMVRYFQLFRQFYRLNDRLYYDGGHEADPYYGRGINIGEFIHFMSAAAGVSEKSQAFTAFQNKDPVLNVLVHATWSVEYEQARVDYPQLNSLYTYVP